MDKENKYIRSLIENAQRGKLGSLEELYKMCLANIFTLTVRLTGDKKLAERFTIDTLVIAWKEIIKQAPENILFENWLRNIAIKVTICGLVGSKECEKEFKKKSSATNDQREAYSEDPLENAIAELDDKSRAIFVLNKIDGKPLATFSGFLGVNKVDAETKLSDSVLNITNLLPNIESEEGLDTLVESLPSKIQPNENLIEFTFSKINEIRIKELRERDAKSEELKELIEIEKKRKKALKKKYKREKVVYKKEKVLKSSDKTIISILLLTSLVSFILFLITTTNEWKLSSVSGKPLKNNIPVVQMEEILPGELISTNDVSTAGIDIADIGRINIFGNTSFTRIQDDNSGELLKGKLKVNTIKAKDNLHIAIPNATIEIIDFGCRYLVNVDPNGSSHIELEKGWLRVSSGSDEIIFPEKYNLKILSRGGAGLPYYSKSGLIQITLIEDYLFNGKKESTLNRIIESATEKDAIILWNLLQRVNSDRRASICNKLNEIVPHPDDITENGILSLDKSMLQRWLHEIKWYL
jgi:DNA-directed RNA polymerase specialized sigma24 family protein